MELYNPEGEISRKALLEQEHYGEVVDIEDPQNNCSVKVTIPNVLEGEVEYLPWVIRLCPTPPGIKAVPYGVPELGQKIRVWFPWGDINKPVYGLDFIHKNLYSDFFSKNSYGMVDSKKCGYIVDKDVDSLSLSHNTIKANCSSAYFENNLGAGSGWTGVLPCGNCLAEFNNGIIVRVTEVN